MFKSGLSLVNSMAKFAARPLYNYPCAGFAEQDPKQLTTKVKEAQKRKDIQQYVDGQLVTRNQMVLKKSEDIDAYVVKTVKNYFRTTNKEGITLESTLEDHGLDSLDSIEISMQIEEDLGYLISAETLPVLQKVKHYCNYIKHIEAYKEETGKAPLA